MMILCILNYSYILIMSFLTKILYYINMIKNRTEQYNLEDSLDSNEEISNGEDHFGERASQSVEEYLHESGEKLPEVKIDFYFKTHKSEKDVEKTQEMFEASDIFIPEAFRWKNDKLEMMQSVSNGDMSPQKYIDSLGKGEISHEHLFALLNQLYKSQKHIILVDMSEEEYKEYTKEKGFDPLLKLTTLYYKKLSYEELLKEQDNVMKEFTALNIKREEVILSNLGPKIHDAIDQNPELKEKEKVNVFLPIGAAHTRLYHSIGKEGEFESRMSFASMPFVDTYFTEGIRRQMFGKEVPESLKSKIIMQTMIDRGGFRDNIYEITDDSGLVVPYLRRVTGMFNEEEIKEYYEQWKNMSLEPDSNEFVDFIKKKLEDKRHKVPTTEKELKEFLAGKDNFKK